LGEIRSEYRILVVKPGRNHFEDLGRDERILEWILGK
jgi:hypothetical protein